jgi:hypothetical protein
MDVEITIDVIRLIKVIAVNIGKNMGSFIWQMSLRQAVINLYIVLLNQVKLMAVIPDKNIITPYEFK